MNRMKILLGILMFCAPILGRAQQISLNEAVERALKNSPKVAAREAAYKVAKANQEKKGYEYIPEIKAETGMQRNFIISSTPVPAKMFYPDAKEGEIYPAKFGTKYSGTAGLNLSYDLFNPERAGNLRMERDRKEMARADMEIEKEKLINRVRLDYAAVLLADKQLQFCVEDTVSADAALDYVRMRMDSGEASRRDYIAAQVDLNESKVRWKNALAVAEKARQTLLAEMGEDVFEQNGHDMILKDDIEKVIELMEDAAGKEYGSNSAVKDALQMRLAKNDLGKAKLGFLPTLSLTGYYGSGYYGPHLHVTDGKYWYGSSYLGIKLTFPISKIANEAAELKRGRAAYQQAQYEAKANELERHRQVIGYRTDVRNARQTMLLQRENVKLANERYEIEKGALETGAVYPAKLKEESRNRFEKEVNYIQAVYEYFVAIANYLLAVKG